MHRAMPRLHALHSVATNSSRRRRGLEYARRMRMWPDVPGCHPPDLPLHCLVLRRLEAKVEALSTALGTQKAADLHPVNVRTSATESDYKFAK